MILTSRTPRPANLILVREDGTTRHIGSVVCRAGATWFKRNGHLSDLRRSTNALGLNTLVIDQLNRWHVTAIYCRLMGTIYTTTVAELERLGTLHHHPGWGWNLNLPIEQWHLVRSPFPLGYVPAGQDLRLPVPPDAPRPALPYRSSDSTLTPTPTAAGAHP